LGSLWLNTTGIKPGTMKLQKNVTKTTAVMLILHVSKMLFSTLLNLFFTVPQSWNCAWQCCESF